MAATHAAAFTLTRPWAEAEFADLLLHPACFTTGTGRCFALVRVIGDEAELLTIATHPSLQRTGLALSCMARWLTTAQARGASRAFLEVATDNDPAIALYRACGFVQTGLRQGYYRRDGAKPVDAMVMARPLP